MADTVKLIAGYNMTGDISAGIGRGKLKSYKEDVVDIWAQATG